jgi:hypothetical protein
LEHSEAYQNAPNFKLIRISFEKRQTIDGEYLHMRSSENTTARLEPVAPGFAVKRTAQSLRTTFQDKTNEVNSDFANYLTFGGMLALGSVSGGQTGVLLTRLDEIRGSLFPLHEGAELHVRAIYGSPAGGADNHFTLNCSVTEKVAAASVHPRLNGEAWKIRCDTHSNVNGTEFNNSSNEYYIDEFAALLGAVGEVDLGRKQVVLPTPGYSYTFETTGKYGSKTVATYDRFDWTVEGSAPEAEAGAANRAATAEKDWGLSATDLSIMIGTDLLKKARFAERRPAILAAAEGGDAVSQYLIGAGYLYGIGAAADQQQKVTWLTKAAQQGLTRAMAALADARIRGDGTERDDISGWSLLLSAANEGNAVAQYNAAMFTLSGVDAGGGMVRRYNYLSRPAALAMLQRSAEAGMAASQYALGHSYLVGSEEHGKDAAQARYWLQKAAAQHLAQAINDLNGMSE